MRQKHNFKVLSAISFAWQLGFLIIIPIGGFMLLGFMADKALKTYPALLISGIITGLIITSYETYHLLIPLIKDND